MKFTNRNLMPLTVTALTLILTFSSCVENEESDGVLALRNAQAALFNAQAEAATTAANAEAAYKAAQTAVENAIALQEQARVAVVEAQARQEEAAATISELEADLYQAQTEHDKQVLQAELEYQQAYYTQLTAQQNYLAQTYITDLEVEAVNAERELAIAKTQLEAALSDYNSKLRDTEDKAALSYLEKYKDAINDVQDLREEITALQFEIEMDKIDLSVYGNLDVNALEENIADKLRTISGFENDIVNYQDEVKELEENIDVYEALIADETGREAAIQSAEDEAKRLNTELETKQVERDEALAVARTYQENEYKKADEAYSELMNGLYWGNVYFLIDENGVYNTSTTTTYRNATEICENVIRSYTNSIASFNETIAGYQKSIATIEEKIASLEATLPTYQSDVTTKQTVYNNTLATFNAAQDEKDAAYAVYQTNPTTANWDAYQIKLTAFNVADVDLNNAKSDLNSAQNRLNNASDDIDSNRNDANNYNSLIDELNDNIIVYTGYKADVEATKVEYEAIYAQLQADYPAILATYKTAQETNNENWQKHQDYSDEANVIETLLGIQENLYNDLENGSGTEYYQSQIDDLEANIDNININSIPNLEENITETELLIENLQAQIQGEAADKTNLENIIANKETELVDMQTELSIKESMATDYKEALDAALNK